MTNSEKIENALRRLVDKLEYVHDHPAFRSVWTVNQLHAGPYTGPTYVDELQNAKLALRGGM